MIANKTYCPECGSETTTNSLGWTSCVNEKCDFEYRVSVPPGLVVEPEKPTLDTLLARRKPLVFRQAESAHGDVKLVADTPFGCYEIIDSHVWFNNRWLFRVDQPQEASELDYQSRVRALFE